MKKRLCLVLSLLMLTICISTLAESAEWNYDAEYCILRGYTGAGGDVVVPAEIDGFTVDVIGINVFKGDTITSLTLPETVLELRSGAVSSCENLTSVTLPQSLVVINRMNFFSCGALTEITIPAGVRYIGDGSFRFCDALRKITFEGVCPAIDMDCFSILPEDAVAYVPDDQLEAYTAAFENAGSTVSVQPSGKNAVVLENNGYVEEEFDFDASTGTITSYNGYATYLAIPETIGGAPVKAIGPEAFASHSYLAFLELPEGLETIGDSAFYNCETLGRVKFPSTLKTIGSNAFYNAYKSSVLELTSVESIGDYAFYFAGIKGSLELPEGLKSIGENAFESCPNMGADLYLPSTLESIGSNAFKGDYNIQYIVLESPTAPTLGENVFAGCDYLYDIDLNAHGSRQEMEQWQAYVDALGLPCRVWRAQDPTAQSPEKGSYTYENCVLTEYTGSQARIHPHLTVSKEPVVGLGDGVFKDNQTIEYFSVAHNDVFTTIGAEAFMNSSLKDVDLFDSVTTIGARAFAGCAQLEELTLPASLTSIGSGALEGCTGLEKLTVCCDPAILPEDMADVLTSIDEVYISADATGAQVRQLSALVGRPWYDPVPREGEPQSRFVEMPYEPLPGDDFWYDEEYSRLDAYQGYDLNLILPREIDGVQLTMIGGGMMNRAAYGDNYDVELPVVSVVIPENYTEIPAYAFSNCDTLETVICYAPIENLSDGTFKGCTNLREVIFVNGVRSLGDYVFSDCLSLEAVYLGAYVENASESAFQDEYGVEYFALEDCITDPAQLPDVDALLAAVKCDPMPEPTPAPTPEPALPVGAEGEPFFGEWHGMSMEMDGETFSFDDFDMVMDLTLNEDGTAALFDGEETDLTSWKVEDGVAIIDTMRGSIQPDGSLCLEEDGSKLYFTRSAAASGAEAVTTPEPEVTKPETIEPETAVPASDDMAAYIGAWHACYLVTGGMTGDPRSAFNLDIVLELNGDGTGSLTFPEPEAHVWYQDAESGAVFFGDGGDAPDMPLTLLEGGFLQYGSTAGDGNALGGYIIFSQDPNAVWMPEFADEPLVSATKSPSAPVTAVDGSAEDRLERKFICTSADIDGYAMDAAMLGGEYSMTFHADGTMDFVMVGTSIPGLVWTQGVVQTDAGEAAAFLVDYYGNTLEAVWTEEGFDMNYFDSMLMHFAPEDSAQ